MYFELFPKPTSYTWLKGCKKLNTVNMMMAHNQHTMHYLHYSFFIFYRMMIIEIILIGIIVSSFAHWRDTVKFLQWEKIWCTKKNKFLKLRKCKILSTMMYYCFRTGVIGDASSNIFVFKCIAPVCTRPIVICSCQI